jgi:DNA-binding transcriptional ArsR family regulator
MTAAAIQLAGVLKALADPTRRAMYERIVSGGEISATSLVEGTRVSQPAVSQHLRTLREAGLIAERRDGRHIRYRAAPEGLAPLGDWVAHYSSFWRTHIDRLEALLKETDQ